MTESTSPEPDPREELASLVASVHALFEQYEATGAGGLAAEPAVAAAFLAGAALPPPRAGAPVAPSVSAPVAPPRAAPQRAEPPVNVAPPRVAAPRAEPPVNVAPPRAEPPVNVAPPRAAPPRAVEVAAVREAPVNVAPPRAAPPRAVEVAPPFDQGAGDDRKMRLAVIADAVRSCTKCPLCETRTQTVFARGNPFSELCFVGEGPGQHEDAEGLPFVGAAGQLLDRMIAAMGYRPDDVYICNIVKCRPPSNRKPEPNEMDACMPYLRDQLALVSPKVIVALGATAAAALTGSTEGIMRMRGKWKLYRGSIPLMPTFHPAYLLRDPAKKREAWNDLQEVMKQLGRAVPRAGADDRGRGDG